MTGDALLRWFPFAFPLLFVAVWLFATMMTGVMSGWFGLQQWYLDEGGEEPVLTLRRQSGQMGLAVGLNGCLNLSAYPSGLGISIWRIFGLFQKPLKVPWSEIEAEPSTTFFVPMVKLQLGKPSNGTLKIRAESWAKLIAAARPVASTPLPEAPPVDRSATVRAMLIQWLAVSALGGTLFYLASRFSPDPLPWAAFALPALLFGVVLLVRLARA